MNYVIVAQKNEHIPLTDYVASSRWYFLRYNVYAALPRDVFWIIN